MFTAFQTLITHMDSRAISDALSHKFGNIHLPIHVTEHCNMKCEHCGGNHGPDMPRDFIPTSDIAALAEMHKSHRKTPNSKIMLTGGECTTAYDTHPNYFSEIFDHCIKNGIILDIKTNAKITQTEHYPRFLKDLSKFQGHHASFGIVMSLDMWHEKPVEYNSKLITDIYKIFSHPHMAIVISGALKNRDTYNKRLETMAENTELRPIWREDGNLKQISHLGEHPVIWNDRLDLAGRAKEGQTENPTLRIAEKVRSSLNDIYIAVKNDGTINANQNFVNMARAKYRDANGNMRQWETILDELSEQVYLHLKNSGATR